MSEPRNIYKKYTPYHYETSSDWKKFARWLRTHLQVSLSLLPEPVRGPLNAKIFDRWDGGGYTCEKVVIETLPGFFSTGNLYRPEITRKKMPAILCPHGHWKDGRLHDWDPTGSVPARCIQLARMGAVVFSYDMVGYNDSCQLPHRTTPEDRLAGLSMAALQTWNSVRALDFVESLSGVDARKIGVTGTSGGATQTYFLAAADNRIAAVAPICMISYRMQGGCVCENPPLLRISATNVDVARLIAPKPLFMGSCTGDWTKATPTEEYPALKNIYELLGTDGKLHHLHVNDEHNYNRQMREAVYGFFNYHLFGAATATPVDEPFVHRPPLRDRMVWWGRSAPKPLSEKTLNKLWTDHIDGALAPFLKIPDRVRKTLGPLLQHVLSITPADVRLAPDAIPAPPENIGHWERNDAGERILIVGDPDPVSTQPAEPHISFPDTYQRSPLAERVRAILAAVESVEGRVCLKGIRSGGPACLIAAAMSSKIKAVEADMAGFNPNRASDWTRCFNIPCIKSIGGLATVFALIGKRPVVLKRATAAVQAMRDQYAR
ncbi:MAG: hypothetical protein ABIH86_01895 [Planctomycetota bacterium]